MASLTERTKRRARRVLPPRAFAALHDLPFAVRYAALLLFSAIGGLIPGTLFALTHRFAPSPAAISTTTGLMQQGSSLGQFLLPPLVALVVSGSGGWSAAWLATGSLALVNVALAGVLLHWRRQR